MYSNIHDRTDIECALSTGYHRSNSYQKRDADEEYLEYVRKRDEYLLMRWGDTHEAQF